MPDADPRRGQRSSELVDAHVHVFPPDMIEDREAYLGRDARFDALYSSPKARMVTADEVVRQMDENGVALSVVFGFAFGDQGLCRVVNDYVLEAERFNPGRLAGVAAVSPGAPGARAELERCLEGGLHGCGELAPDPADLGAYRDLAPVAECLRERGLPLVVHASEPVGHYYPGKGRFTPEACLDMAKAFPGLTIVFAHLGGGLFLYELMPEVRGALVDVFYDTAAVPYLYDLGVYEAVLASVGPEKLIFGSDYPLLSPLRCLVGMERLTDDEQAATQGGNARRVFRL